MIDREKVLQGLESLRDICNAKSNMAIGKGKVAWAGYANTADDAIALLKKQEAKPVNVSENAYGYKNYYCPNCGKWFDYKDVERKYCHRCGQEVKWDD